MAGRDVATPINGDEWPVPVTKDVNFDLIRIEMVNAGAEYASLDVLCSRQMGGRREDLHAREWQVDVPTIGFLLSRRKSGLLLWRVGTAFEHERG